jgi:mono/diheme cytochrome c family protein
MKSPRIWVLRPGILARMVLVASASFLMLAAQEPKKAIKHVEAKPPVSTNGGELFKEYCAVCHGNDAKGGGPAADALKKRPADLTQLSRKNGGKFPELRVMNYIHGQDVVAAHGSRDMPIWGSVFSQLTNKDLAYMRINILIKYLVQIQAK